MSPAARTPLRQRVTLGAERFRLLELHAGAPYLTGTVEYLNDAASDGDSWQHALDLRAELSRLAERYHTHVHVPSAPIVSAESPVELTWEIADGIVLDLAERQRLLSSPDVLPRMKLLRSYLRRECGLFEALPSLPAADLSGNKFSIN